jgi:serine/threonine-protein kinase
LILDADAGAATQINVAAIKMEPASAPAVWDDTVLRTVERQLAHFVGPMARIMIRKAAEQTTDVDQLYTLLSDNIADPVKRQRFCEGGQAAGATSKTTAPRFVLTGEHAQTQQGRPLEQTFVDQTTMRLAVYLGPIAKVVAGRAAQKAATQQEFVELVAGHLGAQDRGAFLREIGFGEGP